MNPRARQRLALGVPADEQRRLSNPSSASGTTRRAAEPPDASWADRWRVLHELLKCTATTAERVHWPPAIHTPMHLPRPASRHFLFSALATVLAVVALAPSPASAQESTTTTVDARREAVDRSNGLLRAEATAVRSEVIRLGAEVAASEERLAVAEVEQAAANNGVDTARSGAVAADRSEAAQRATVKRVAASGYMYGPTALNVILAADDLNDAARRQRMATAASEANARTLTRLRAAKVAAVAAEEQARAAAEAAKQAVAAASAAAKALTTRRAAQEAALVAVAGRLERSLAEAAALADIDAEAATTMAERDGPLATLPRPAQPIPVFFVPRSAVSVVTVRVGGIRVAQSLGPRLEALLAAAAGAGIPLGGGGYRDPAAQIALRAANCGSTDYDVYERPSAECSPPTALPGTSMHEQGLAIDLTSNGRAILSDADPEFAWLAANAPSFGLINLAGEPWHWSTTGS